MFVIVVAVVEVIFAAIAVAAASVVYVLSWFDGDISDAAVVCLHFNKKYTGNLYSFHSSLTPHRCTRLRPYTLADHSSWERHSTSAVARNIKEKKKTVLALVHSNKK